MHADYQYFIEKYNIRYLNHLIQHLSSSLLLNVVLLDELYDYIYDMFPNVVTFDYFNEYEFQYCQHNNINYSDYVIDYCANKLISFKK